jgi:hypothetical protein
MWGTERCVLTPGVPPTRLLARAPVPRDHGGTKQASNRTDAGHSSSQESAGRTEGGEARWGTAGTSWPVQVPSTVSPGEAVTTATKGGSSSGSRLLPQTQRQRFSRRSLRGGGRAARGPLSPACVAQGAEPGPQPPGRASRCPAAPWSLSVAEAPRCPSLLRWGFAARPHRPGAHWPPSRWVGSQAWPPRPATAAPWCLSGTRSGPGLTPAPGTPATPSSCNGTRDICPAQSLTSAATGQQLWGSWSLHDETQS